MRAKREDLYQRRGEFLLEIGKDAYKKFIANNKNVNIWESNNFKDLDSVISLLVTYNREMFNPDVRLKEFIELYACDLVNKNPDEDVWGAAIQYCKVKPTPEQEVLEAQIKFIDDNVANRSFNGGEVTTLSNQMKVYDKIIGDKAFRFFPPNKNNELKYFEYSDNTYTTPYYSGTYSLTGFMPESINESVKRWLDIMNKTSRVRIKEQTILTRTETKTNPDYIKKQAEIKTNADKHSELSKLSPHFVSIYWNNPIAMKQKTKEVEDLLKSGWRGEEFAYFLKGLEIKGYTDLMGVIDEALSSEEDYSLTNPTNSEILSGDYESRKIDGFVKPVYYLRGGNSDKSTDSKAVSEENCKKALAEFYSSCGGAVSNLTTKPEVFSLRDDKETFYTSKEFQQKKDFILACDSKNYYTQGFKKIKDAFNRDFYEYRDMTRELSMPVKTNPNCRIRFQTKR